MSNGDTDTDKKKTISGRVGGMMGAGQRKQKDRTSKPMVAEGDGEKMFEKPAQSEKEPAQPAGQSEDLRVSPPSPAPKAQEPEFKYEEVPIHQIRSWKYKDRTMAEIDSDPKFQELVDGIRAHGVLQSITVRKLENPDGEILYEQIYGLKRLTAARLVGLKTIPAKVYPKMADLDAAMIQQQENSGKSDPSYYSQACHYKNLVDDGVVDGVIGLVAMFGKDRKSIANYIRVAREMRDEFKEHLNLHDLSAKALFELLSLSKDGGSVSAESMVKVIVDHKDEINENPNQTLNILSRIEKEARPASPKQTPDIKVIEVDGREAFKWQRSKKGATISVSADIAKKLDDDLIEKTLKDLINRL